MTIEAQEDVVAAEESLAELAREQHVVAALYGIAKAVAQKHDLQEIVQLVTDETTTLTGAQFGAFVYDVSRRDGERYSLYTISGASAADSARFPTPRPTEIFTATFEGTATVRIDDVHEDPRFGRNPPSNGMPPEHLPVRSYLAVPVLTADGDVAGGLFFGHERAGVFTEEHERIAAEVATQAGIAIEKARLLAAERDARAEAEARADAAAALELVEDGVVMVDRAGYVRLWNRAAAAITGLDANTVLGRPIGEAVPAWERVALDVPVGNGSETIVPRTLPFDTLDGREVWVSLYGVAFGDGTVYAFRDVTSERELEVVRADVVATVSHELRTPVAAVYGATQTLRHRAVEPELAAQLLDVIESESRRLTTLVEEILLTSQIDSGSVRIARERVDPARVVAAAVETAALDAERASIAVEVPDAVPAVAADEEKLRQVLVNLVENALKYGGGRIAVRVRPAATNVRFEVADDGPGIPRHEQTHVFEKFYRLDPHLTRGVRGTGLGLYICHELVRRMHGTIGVQSEPGCGARFWFELPRSR